MTRETNPSTAIATFPVSVPGGDVHGWYVLHETGVTSMLAVHFDSLPFTTVASGVPVGPGPSGQKHLLIPDLMVAFESDRELVIEQRGYSIEHQGKPPDFALEVVRPDMDVWTTTRPGAWPTRDTESWNTGASTRAAESGPARRSPETFSSTTAHTEPIEIESLGETVWRGYSELLGLDVRWENGKLRFYYPETGEYLRSHHESEAEVRRLRARLAELGERR